MSAPSTESIKHRVENVVTLARLLERLERGTPPIAADQYQALVRQLKVALGKDMPDEALQAVLTAYPAAGELYENMHYERAGLCRSGLERSVSSEMQASQALARAAARP